VWQPYGECEVFDLTAALADPAAIAVWSVVPVSTRIGCYGRRHVPSAVAALHPDGRLLAVAVGDGITVIDLDES
jgi:hypothetical protein